MEFPKVSGMEAGDGTVPEEAGAHPDVDETKKWLAPEGYMVTELGGIHKVTSTETGRQIAAAPIKISETGCDPFGDEFLTLTWKYRGQETSLTAPRSEIYGNSTLKTMTARGAPFTTANRNSLQTYFQAQENEHCAKIPRVPVRTEGWSKDFDAYTIGQTVIGEQGRLYHSAGGAFVEALGAKGLESQHKAVTEQTRDGSAVAEMCWAAGFAAPLLRPLQLRSMVFSIWGPSGSGKSALQALAMSAWGRPESLKHTGDISKAALELVMAARNDFLLWVDDTQQSTQEKFLEQMFYSVASGSSATRATADGGLRDQKSWRSLVLVSGEHPVLKIGAAEGGQRRGIEFEVRPMNEFEARAIHTQLSQHHGWTGPKFVEEFMSTFIKTSKLDKLALLYHSLEEQIAKQDRSAWSNHVTLLALADLLARMFVCGESEARAEECAIHAGVEVLRKAVEAKADTKTSFQAGYQLLQSFVQENLQDFQQEHKPFIGSAMGRIMKVDGKSAMVLLPGVFKRFCAENALNERQFLAEARTNECLLPNTYRKGTNQRIVKFGDRAVSAYVFVEPELVVDLEEDK